MQVTRELLTVTKVTPFFSFISYHPRYRTKPWKSVTCVTAPLNSGSGRGGMKSLNLPTSYYYCVTN